MLWSIDSCQNRISADQYHLTVSRAQVSTHRGRVFFEVIRWQFTRFQMIAGSRLLFLKFISNMLCLCQYRPALLRFWFQTDLRRKNSASFFKNTGGEDLFLSWSCVGHAGRPIFKLWLVEIWQVSSWKFVQHLESLTAEAYRVLCQLVMFLTVFFQWMYKIKYSSYQESSVIHGWFVYCVFGWEMRRLSKWEIRFRIASFLFFTLLDA